MPRMMRQALACVACVFYGPFRLPPLKRRAFLVSGASLFCVRWVLAQAVTLAFWGDAIQNGTIGLLPGIGILLAACIFLIPYIRTVYNRLLYLAFPFPLSAMAALIAAWLLTVSFFPTENPYSLSLAALALHAAVYAFLLLRPDRRHAGRAMTGRPA